MTISYHHLKKFWIKYVGNSLIDMYAKCKGMLDTYRMFNNTLLPCGHSNNKVEHSKCKAIEIE
jgi:hypothetical protein